MSRFTTLLVRGALLAGLLAYLTGLFSSPKSIQGVFPPPENYFSPPKGTDSRSPCPALNTLANHGFLPRDGRGITHTTLRNALQEGFHTSLPLATFLTYGGYILLQQWGAISLQDLARHNHTEHLASLAHGDAVPEDSEYAPTELDLELLEELMGDADEEKDGFDVESCARARVRREDSYPGPLDAVHAIIGRGEMTLVLGIMGGEEQVVGKDMLRKWFVEERFPQGWRPGRVQSLTRTLMTQLDMRLRMARIRKEKAAGEKES